MTESERPVLVCLQCSLRAMLDGQPNPSFDETPEDHMARCHADREVCQRERETMEAELRRRGMGQAQRN